MVSAADGEGSAGLSGSALASLWVFGGKDGERRTLGRGIDSRLPEAGRVTRREAVGGGTNCAAVSSVAAVGADEDEDEDSVDGVAVSLGSCEAGVGVTGSDTGSTITGETGASSC